MKPVNEVVETLRIFGSTFEVTKARHGKSFSKIAIGTDKRTPIFVYVNNRDYLTRDGWVEGSCDKGWFKDMREVHKAIYLYVLRNST